jgi:hypothetical protein
MNTVDRSDLTAGIANQLGDPAIPAPNFLGEVSSQTVSQIDQVQQQEAAATQAIDQLDTYNQQLGAAYDTYEQSTYQYPQGDPRIEQAQQTYESLRSSSTIAQLSAQAGIATPDK